MYELQQVKLFGDGPLSLSKHATMFGTTAPAAILEKRPTEVFTIDLDWMSEIPYYLLRKLLVNDIFLLIMRFISGFIGPRYLCLLFIIFLVYLDDLLR